MSKIRQIDNAEVLHSIFIGRPVYMLRKISEETTFAEAIEADAFIVLEEEDEADTEADGDAGTGHEGNGSDGISEDISREDDRSEYATGCADGQSDEGPEEIDGPDYYRVEVLPPDKYPARKKKRKSGVDHGKIIACRRAGRSIKWIAEECNCSDQTVYNHLKKEGLK